MKLMLILCYFNVNLIFASVTMILLKTYTPNLISIPQKPIGSSESLFNLMRKLKMDQIFDLDP